VLCPCGQERRPAQAFVDGTSVTRDTVTRLPALYNLQLDREGTFMANGMAVQAHSPFHFTYPLPRAQFSTGAPYMVPQTYDQVDPCLPLRDGPCQGERESRTDGLC
jgi:hypothetical protein